jgi:hypothetical protein
MAIVAVDHYVYLAGMMHTHLWIDFQLEHIHHFSTPKCFTIPFPFDWRRKYCFWVCWGCTGGNGNIWCSNSNQSVDAWPSTAATSHRRYVRSEVSLTNEGMNKLGQSSEQQDNTTTAETTLIKCCSCRFLCHSNFVYSEPCYSIIIIMNFEYCRSLGK